MRAGIHQLAGEHVFAAPPIVYFLGEHVKVRTSAARLRPLMILLAAGLAATACSHTPTVDPVAQDPDPLYAGQLLTSEMQDGLPDASQNLRISYISTSHDGHDAVVYGRVALPSIPPPPGGYPVISWGEGSTGVAPQCAPSLIDDASYDAYLNEWLKRGYAVLRTDYEGWGAAGPRPLLNQKSNSNGIVDIVTAAHSISSELSNDWIAIGHSEGGGAALWTAGLNDQVGGKYPLKGAIAIAPTGPGVLKFTNGVKNGEPISQLVQMLLAWTVAGAQATDPTIEVQQVVTDPMMLQVDAAKASCETSELPQLEAGQYFLSGEGYDKVVNFLRDQDPSSLAMKVPVSIIQGDRDETTVTPDTTEQMIQSLCGSNASIQYKLYPGENHGTVIDASQNDAFSFAMAAFADTAPENSC
ncbi:MAG: alpha/beta hydrolase [Rhodococcus sp. (in: high G+C Gram-positive bacteria)]|uniref:alpha/beta hydrolase family protein n=1 Tax=Rhodococcus sp. TaxID=1831 RepID=UPI002ADB0167|nr:alpha/beta hydrolase [Rhodococcus sp. (in: high G+C Gram-positive bacteria)]